MRRGVDEEVAAAARRRLEQLRAELGLDAPDPPAADPGGAEPATSGRARPVVEHLQTKPAEAGERPQGQGQTRPRFDKTRKPFGDDKKPFDGKKFAGKRDRDDWKEHRPREKREVTLDPDSPWAALAALRTPKTE